MSRPTKEEVRPTMEELEQTEKMDFTADAELTAEVPFDGSSPGVALPVIDVFDNLSKTLADQAGRLGPDDAKLEEALRPLMVEALKGLSHDQSEVGRLLCEYRSVYKSKGHWTRIAKEIGTVINCSARTIYRMIDNYEALSAQVTQSKTPFDRTEVDGPELRKQERNERDARLAIRVFLNNIPNDKKQEALARLLAEEAYQVWGLTEPFTIHVKPHRSCLTIDGRKKQQSKHTEEKAA